MTMTKTTAAARAPRRAPRKPYRGMAMEGVIASWYAKNTGGDTRDYKAVADAVTRDLPAGARVLEVAPGPGYMAIEIARRGLFRVSGLDISESFVRIARANAREAGQGIDFQRGNASQMPYADGAFDFAVCRAAFKNFSDPLGALDEIHRVLAPGARAAIYDLRKEATRQEIDAEIRRMELQPVNAVLTRWIFRTTLLKTAYTREALEALVAASRFGRGEIRRDGIGFELRLAKAPE